MSTNDFTNRIILAVVELEGCRAWRNNRLTARAGKRIVKAGIDGQADVTGILAPSGRRLEIEVKCGSDRPEDHQLDFGRMILRAGGVHMFACDATAYGPISRKHRDEFTVVQGAGGVREALLRLDHA